jgi:hypothetical protein
MAVRDSMEALIQKVRFEIGDVVQPYTFTDQEIQDSLDRRRRDVRANLRANPTYLVGGAVEYNEFWASEGDWEADAVLQDGSYNTLTPLDTSDQLLGVWRFEAGEITYSASVYMFGKTYDVYGTAADLCSAWLARIKMEFSTTGDNNSFSRQERVANLQTLEKALRKRAKIVTSRFVRPDVFGYRASW